MKQPRDYIAQYGTDFLLKPVPHRPDWSQIDYEALEAFIHIIQKETRGEQQSYIDHLEERSQWQPIETAPKDGTRVLLYHKFNPNYGDGCVVQGEWDKYYKCFCAGTTKWSADFWMPQPPPPVVPQPEEKAPVSEGAA